MVRLTCCALVVALIGCAPEVSIAEGRFACDTDLDCPPRMSCRADRRCWTDQASSDAGPLPDGAARDAATDAGPRDAATDAGHAPLDAAPDAAADAGDGPPPPLVTCQGATLHCGNGIDDDGDGLTDSDDPDCTGPCDNSESSLDTSVVGAGSCVVDCYFDPNLGAGDDDCVWNHACDELSVPPDYPPRPELGATCEYDPGRTTSGQSCSDLQATQSSGCLDTCGPLVPNGCDCFGCCEIGRGSGSFVYLGSRSASGEPGCDASSTSDPAACHPCTPVGSCFNSCDTCELCFGETALPAACGPAETGLVCPAGAARCGLPGLARCPAGQFCLTGCCAPQPE